MAIFLNVKTFKIEDTRDRKFDFPNDESETSDKKGWFGTYVISNLEFPSGSYIDNDGNKIDFKGIRIDAVVMSVNQQKIIVKTKIQGLNGTVKQYISDGDFEIEATGVIVGGSSEDSGGNFTTENLGNVVPQQEIRKLKAIFSVPQEIQVASDFLDYLEISTVVIDGYTFEQVEGSEKEIRFNIKMCSDTPIELK